MYLNGSLKTVEALCNSCSTDKSALSVVRLSCGVIFSKSTSFFTSSSVQGQEKAGSGSIMCIFAAFQLLRVRAEAPHSVIKIFIELVKWHLKMIQTQINVEKVS